MQSPFEHSHQHADADTERPGGDEARDVNDCQFWSGLADNLREKLGMPMASEPAPERDPQWVTEKLRKGRVVREAIATLLTEDPSVAARKPKT